MTTTNLPEESTEVEFQITLETVRNLRQSLQEVGDMMRKIMPNAIKPSEDFLSDQQVIDISLLAGGFFDTFKSRVRKGKEETQDKATRSRPPDAESESQEERKKKALSLFPDAEKMGLPINLVKECLKFYALNEAAIQKAQGKKPDGKKVKMINLKELIVRAFDVYTAVYSGKYYKDIQKHLAQEGAMMHMMIEKAQKENEDDEKESQDKTPPLSMMH